MPAGAETISLDVPSWSYPYDILGKVTIGIPMIKTDSIKKNL